MVGWDEDPLKQVISNSLHFVNIHSIDPDPNFLSFLVQTCGDPFEFISIGNPFPSNDLFASFRFGTTVFERKRKQKTRNRWKDSKPCWLMEAKKGTCFHYSMELVMCEQGMLPSIYTRQPVIYLQQQ